MLDLTDSVVVLGGGLNGSFVARELLRGGMRVVMIDAGYDCNQDLIEPSVSSSSAVLKSHKFGIESASYVYGDFLSKLNIKTKNFQAVGSLAKGGLSNIWGGGLSRFEKHELSHPSIDYDELRSIYSYLTQEMLNSLKEPVDDRLDLGFDKRFESIFDCSIGRVKFSQPISALSDKSKVFNSTRYDNKGVYNARIMLEELQHNNNFTLLTDRLIEKVIPSGRDYHIYTENIKIKGGQLIKARTIFCCLGVLSTTKIAMRMNGVFDIPVPIANTPMFYFSLFTLKKRMNQTEFGLPSLSFEINNSASISSGGIFPCNKEMIDHFAIFKSLPSCLKMVIDQLFLQRLFIGNMFFSSDYSLNTVTLDKTDTLIVQGATKPTLKKMKSECLSHLRQSLKRFNIGIIPFVSKSTIPGSDVHYSGTIPMKTNGSGLSCSPLGVLKGHKLFYIADASFHETIPGKPNTFTSIAQSIYITRKYVFRMTGRTLK